MPRWQINMATWWRFWEKPGDAKPVREARVLDDEKTSALLEQGLTRKLLLLAAAGAGKQEFLDRGYRQVSVNVTAPNDFDFLYEKGDEIVALDGYSEASHHNVIETAGGTAARGTIQYTNAAIDLLRPRDPDVAARMAAAVRQKAFRYLQVREVVGPEMDFEIVEFPLY